MSLAFMLLGGSAFLLALSLRPRLYTRGGRIGRWGLLVIGAAYFVAGVFPPIRTPLIVGYLHGISGLVAIFGSPIAFTLITRSLVRSQTQDPLSHRLRLATLVAWGGLFLSVVSLVPVNLTEGVNTPLPPWLSLANRVMIASYCIWLIIAAQSATWKQPSLAQRNGENV